MVIKYANPETVFRLAYHFSQPEPTNRIRWNVVCRKLSTEAHKFLETNRKNIFKY